MREIGERLRAERKRLGLGQAELGQIGNVKIQAQGLYENGDRVPRADYLARVSEAGIDVQFVITGLASNLTTYESSARSEDERRLLLAFRQLDDAGRASALMIVSLAGRGAVASKT